MIISGNKLGPLENKVLDIIGRDSARIRALKIPDMQVGPQSSQTNSSSESQAVPGSSLAQQVEEASLIFVDDQPTGPYRFS